jgi:bis(5'-nucleosidyl)-tetraphosphatase
MEKDESFGVIPLRKNEGGFQVFLVRHRKGMHWGFPKGHRSFDQESPKEIAEREFKEETNFDIERFISGKSFQETYILERDGKKIEKTVIYFLIEAKGSFKPQEIEIVDGGWVDIEQASKKITFLESQKICEELISLIKKENV